MVQENDMSGKNSSISLIILVNTRKIQQLSRKPIPAESRANTWPMLLGKFLVAKIYLKKREFQRDAL
jgi:hypothetical protein